jgi:iron(III) transport system substrate-binding protein
MRTDKKGRNSFTRLVSSVTIGAASVALFLSLMTGLFGGCDRGGAKRELVLYTSVDEPVARPIVAEFTKRTGIRVALQTDTEANKSAGLVARLEAERANPRADVWWGNEVFRTIALAEAGVLAPYESPAAKDVPDAFKDPAHRWAGSGQRVRVVAVHTHPGAREVNPLPRGSIEDLARPELKGHIAIADPRAGTTSGHVAALYVLWGDAKAEQFFRSLRANDVKVVGGNGDVATEAAKGTVWAGLTDNDDVANAAAEGGHLGALVPDQAEGQIGTLTIPCTVALVAGAKHPEDAKKLVDYLLSAEVEKRLIDAKFARYSVREGGGDADAEKVKRMNVDYNEVAKVLRRAASSAHAILVGRE